MTVKPQQQNEPEKKEEIHYLALGDSYTIGESVPSHQNFPAHLSEELKKKGFSVSTEIIATTGWTTQNLKQAIERKNLTPSYNLVSLLIGVNNQYQGKSIEEYETEFEELLKTAIKLAGNNKEKVFVVSIPDYGYTPFGESKKEEISKEIDAFNNVNKRITNSFGITYIDITPISREGLANPSYVASDGLHPSGTQYKEWIQFILKNLKF